MGGLHSCDRIPSETGSVGNREFILVCQTQARVLDLREADDRLRLAEAHEARALDVDLGDVLRLFLDRRGDLALEVSVFKTLEFDKRSRGVGDGFCFDYALAAI